MIKIDESQFVNPQDLTGVYAQPDPVQQEAMICSITTYRAPNKLHVGDGIPHVPLTALADGQSVDLRDLAAKRPLVLFFAVTPDRLFVVRLATYRQCNQFQDRADFYVIYIAEAHATDEWQLGINEQESVLLPQHRQFEERLAAAWLCAEALQLHMPTLVDGMDNAASTLFCGLAERIYILDKGGVVHYRGGYGPFDFKPDEAAISLAELLSE